ncbi:MAG: peroxiredoxin [Pelagibacteraceae bacterium TMED65]|nr:peroxiredoxin [Rickettsiales bacterium]OUU51633.1 MAG: peroxiredoxin [Pelagibacteraceae bacterium TMED65]|tara:strand:+ start:237 stop:692 length:456 start_codon:yes stop_codon:yes gene_type:complete
MKIGEKLNNVKLLLEDGNNFSSDEFLGKKLIIYFYPKDDTPGCTKEAIEFSELIEEFKKNNTQIIGISKDSLEKHQKFISKHKLKVKLASDEDLEICKKFGVWVEKSMYGKKYMGIERSTFLFDQNLILIKEWKKVKVNNHAQEVLEYIVS